LPAALGRLGAGQAGSFVTGFFATLLATPCSAPFVGTAVAFALSQGSVETVVIFLAMGLGLAAPYLLVAARPQLATALPKPGRWMIWVRAVLGVALAATAVWLGSILWALAGQTAALGLAIVAGALLIWLAVPAGRLRLPVAGVLVAASLVLPPILAHQSPAAKNKAAVENAVWMTFSQDYLADLVANGRTVMVDVTADWCITCKANKAAVLDRGEVMKMLENDVAALRADWTKPDPAIQAYLASFERYGIPFNAVYGPGAPGGIALPEILTESAVLEAFEQAAAAN
jgi:suppressor for copper-sensitivity B